MNLIELPSKINDFFIILFSILVEGIPFILIGGILSALVELYVSEERIQRLLPKNRFLRFSSMGVLGNVTPVCECGNIPFARRMISKNIEPAFVLTFLLAAPVFNPIVITSTVVAFPNDLSIILYRLLFTFIIAVGIGYVLSLFKAGDVLIEKLLERRKKSQQHKHEHSHDKQNFLGILQKEFLEMSAIFLFGASIASLFQVVIPKELIFNFNEIAWVAILAMMVLAFIVSICSNVDAFFALAYSQIFPTSAILAFLVLGPMLDIKAIPMYKTIFNWRALALIIALIASLTFLLTYLHFLLT